MFSKKRSSLKISHIEKARFNPSVEFLWNLKTIHVPPKKVSRTTG